MSEHVSMYSKIALKENGMKWCAYLGPEMHTNAKKIEPEVVTASPGDNVVFTCQTQAFTLGDYGDLHSIQWLHNGEVIEGKHTQVSKLKNSGS